MHTYITSNTATDLTESNLRLSCLEFDKLITTDDIINNTHLLCSQNSLIFSALHQSCYLFILYYISNTLSCFLYYTFFTGGAVREYYWEPYVKPNVDYTLFNVYNRVVINNRVPVQPHHSRDDTYMIFRISHVLGQKFLDWADNPDKRRHCGEVQDGPIEY